MQFQQNRIKIIITDDHRIFRQGVINGLIKIPEIEIIGEAVNGLDLLEKLEYLEPDIVIMGINMPVMNGLVALPKLKQKYPALKVIMLTMYDDPSMICHTIKLGANAYLNKSCSFEEIYEAILACKDNWIFINELVRNALQQTDPKYQTKGKGIFGDRELQILKLLSVARTVQDISSEMQLSMRTIEAIIERIKEKAEADSLDQLIKFATERELI